MSILALACLASLHLSSHVLLALEFKPCLSNPVTAKKVKDANGIVRPIRVGSGNWDAPIILARIAQILLNEVIGIEADFYSQFGGSADLIKNLTGCLNDDCSEIEDYPYIQFDFENWFTVAGEKILAAQPNALVKGYIGYDGQEGLYMKKTIADAIWKKYKLPLVYFQSLYHPNRSMWMESFTKVSDISIASDDGCRGKTADSMKGVGLICDPDGWWYSPACASDKDSCIPVLMGGVGWLGLETAQVINYTSMPMAVTFIGWPDQRILQGSVDAMFFWWRPDWTYNSVGTVERFLFPKHDRAAWDKGVFETDFPDFQLKKYMAQHITKISYKASQMFDRFTLNWIQINELMDTMERRKNEVNPDMKSTVACDWVKSTSHVWRAWIPDREPCKPGEGLQDDGSCVRCPPGTKSELDANSSELACKNCTEGYYSNAQGGTSCELCTPGKFGSSLGMAECERCSIEGYTPGEGFVQCIPCGGEGDVQLVTEYPGAENASACSCPSGFYRDKFDWDRCHACPEGMTCAWGSSAEAGASTYPLLKPLYWSSESDPLSVYTCDGEERCPGGEPGSCGDKMITQSCAHCIDGWVFDGQNCNQCTSVEKTQVLFPTSLLLLLPVLVILLYKLLADQYSKWGSWQNGFMSCGFILLNHYQVITMLTGVNMKIPLSIEQYYKFWSFTGDLGGLFNPECAGYDFKRSLIFKAIFPGVYLATGFIVWWCSRMNAFVNMEVNRTFNAVVSIMLTFFAAIVGLSLTLFICKVNPNDTSSLAADRSITCFEADWNDMLAVGLVGILIWCIGVGSVFTWAIITKPSKMHDPAVQTRWKFLFIKFRPDRYWWAVVFVAKGVALNFGLVILRNGVSQIFWMMAILTFYTALATCFMPWRHMVVNLLDITTHMFLNLSGACLVWFAKDFVAASELADLNQDLSNCAVALSMLVLPIAIISCGNIFRSQNSLQAKLEKYSAMEKIRIAFTSISRAPDEVFASVTQGLSEWDFWFLTQASSTIMFEYLAIKSRAGYTTVVLNEEQKTKRQSERQDTRQNSEKVDTIDESLHSIREVVGPDQAWLCDALACAVSNKPYDIDSMRTPREVEKDTSREVEKDTSREVEKDTLLEVPREGPGPSLLSTPRMVLTPRQFPREGPLVSTPRMELTPRQNPRTPKENRRNER